MTGKNYIVTMEGKKESDDDDLHFLLMAPDILGISTTPQVPNQLVLDIKALCDSTPDDAFWSYNDLKRVATEDGEEVPHGECLVLNAITKDEAWFALLMRKNGDKWDVLALHADEVVAEESFQSASPEDKARKIVEKVKSLPGESDKYSTIHLIHPFEAGREYPF
ncbi:MAG: hypothetical protein ACTSU5_12205 [Promethearchaeota archaeon]